MMLIMLILFSIFTCNYWRSCISGSGAWVYCNLCCFGGLNSAAIICSAPLQTKWSLLWCNQRIYADVAAPILLLSGPPAALLAPSPCWVFPWQAACYGGNSYRLASELLSVCPLKHTVWLSPAPVPPSMAVIVSSRSQRLPLVSLNQWGERKSNNDWHKT